MACWTRRVDTMQEAHGGGTASNGKVKEERTMGAERLIEDTWIRDFGAEHLIAHSEMADDPLITVKEIGTTSGTFAVVLFSTKLLDSDLREMVWTKLQGFDPDIDQRAHEAAVDLRGVLLRIMDTGWNWGHVYSDAPVLRLSLLEGWRGLRLVDYAGDMLVELAQKCGSQQC